MDKYYRPSRHTHTGDYTFSYLDEDNVLGLAVIDPETGEYDPVEVELDVEYEYDALAAATELEPAEGGVQDILVKYGERDVTDILPDSTLEEIIEDINSEVKSDDGYRD